MKQYIENDLFMRNKFVGAPTPSMVEFNATLSKLTNETFTRIILGDLPVDAFDEYVKNWSNLGGNKMTTEANEWYAANKK
jgi:putative aldouronate transport system substrate-binding protein